MSNDWDNIFKGAIDLSPDELSDEEILRQNSKRGYVDFGSYEKPIYYKGRKTTRTKTMSLYRLYKSGRLVYLKTGKARTPFLRGGSYCVDIDKRPRRLARLVAGSFLGYQAGKHDLLFRDGNKKNHKLSNLYIIVKPDI
jgi:hypothetical protein